ncbi:MAG: cytochrome P450 [Actinomycetota bacterium]|nr:cytochrome P450 [Actinomycetota bacterium]
MTTGACLNTTNPFTATGPGERHVVYAALAAGGPVHRITLPTGEPAWLITGYDEVRHTLRDPRVIKSEAALANIGHGLVPPEVFAGMSHHMLNSNPPDHARLRRLVTAAFTRRRIEQLAPRIQQITDQLLDAMPDAAQVDLIDSFAYPLPLTVICELLGVPANHRAEFRGWSSIVVTGVLAGRDTLVAATTAMVSYLRKLVNAKRATPTDDMLSALVAVRDGDDCLSDDELTSMAWLLLVAGHETTVNLIGNGVLALLTHPEQLALLRAEPDRLPAAIEELLRFDGALQVATFRWTAEPVDIGGIAIPAGEIVLLGLLAANRDPACTAQPDALDITRMNNPHLAFGHGIHHCLGAPLARLEGRIALGSLLARFPNLRLAVPPEELTWKSGALMHGLTALPVVLDRPTGESWAHAEPGLARRLARPADGGSPKSTVRIRSAGVHDRLPAPSSRTSDSTPSASTMASPTPP